MDAELLIGRLCERIARLEKEPRHTGKFRSCMWCAQREETLRHLYLALHIITHTGGY